MLLWKPFGTGISVRQRDCFFQREWHFHDNCYMEIYHKMWSHTESKFGGEFVVLRPCSPIAQLYRVQKALEVKLLKLQALDSLQMLPKTCGVSVTQLKTQSKRLVYNSAHRKEWMKYCKYHNWHLYRYTVCCAAPQFYKDLQPVIFRCRLFFIPNPHLFSSTGVEGIQYKND